MDGQTNEAPQMIEVIVPRNFRIVDDYATDLRGANALVAGQTRMLNERQLRSLGLRAALLGGQLRVTKGTVKFPYKNSMVVIEGIPGGNTTLEMREVGGTVHVKDLQTYKITTRTASEIKTMPVVEPIKVKPLAEPVKAVTRMKRKK